MPDELVCARAAGGAVRLIAATTTELVREAQARHGFSPTASAAVGRLLTGAVLLCSTLKTGDRLSIQLAGNGPLGGAAAEAAVLDDGTLGARAYARVPTAELPLNEHGKFDVGGVVGRGTLHVTKSFAVGQPYVGIVPLVSGEIGDDLAAYLWDSEQVPSIVALGVLAKPNGIAAAGGAIAQILPGADESILAGIEEHARRMPHVTAQMSEGAGASDLALTLAGSLDVRFLERSAIAFRCRCSREKVEVALLGLGRDQLEEMAATNEDAQAVCEYCKTAYVFSPDEVGALLARTAKPDATA